MYDRWDVDLNLKVEHVIARNRLTDFKEVLLATTIEVIDKEAAWIPIVLGLVEYFELDESCLSCLHCRMILILGALLLLGYMLDVGQILDRDSALGTEHP